MKHNLIISAFLLPLTVAGQWTYQGTYLGLDFPLDSVLVENLSQGGDITVPGEDSLGQVVVGVSDIAHPVTGGSALLPGRPNPFHTHTTFGLFIEKAGDATLMVFDATGRSITGLEVKNLAPGNHGFQFNGPHVGVYFVSCVTGGMRHVLRLVQLAGNGESDLHHTGTSTAQPKDGYRDTFPWTPGDVVRHTAYATLPCGAQARHVVVDVPDAIEHYSMPLTQVAPGDSPCLFTDRQSIELPAACVGGTSTQSFRLVGENLTCSTIPIGPVDGYTFALAGADPFQNTLAIPVDTDATVNDTIHVRFTPDDENGNITDLYLTCGSIQTTVHLLGTVSSTQAAGVLTGDQNICVGDSSTFSSSVSGGSWTSSDPDIATINANTGLVNGIAADTATMTYTVSTPGCADAIATLIVTVYPDPATPTITANGPTSFCVGGSVVLTSSSATGNVWSPGGQITQSITVGTNGNYSVTVTNDQGCSATSATSAVTVNAAPTVPTITANGPTTFCVGGSVILTSSSTTGNVWSPGGQTTQSITVGTSGDYSVTVTNGQGCSATSATSVVTVNPNPFAPTITPSGPTTFCTGGSVQLTSSSTTGNVWSPGGQTTQSITVNTSGNYSVTVTNGLGCSATTATTSVTVTAPPTAPTIAASGPTTFCVGGSVNLTSSSTTGNVWSPGGQTTQSITVGTSGNYWVTVTNDQGCISAPSQQTQVSTVAPPSAGLDADLELCITGQPVSLIGALGGVPQVGGSWNGPSPVANGQYAPLNMAPGEYTYTVPGGLCPDATATVTVSETADLCPTLVVEPDTIDLGTICVGTPLDVGPRHVFSLSGIALESGPIDIGPYPGAGVTDSPIGILMPSVTLQYAGGTGSIDPTLVVGYSPSATGPFTVNIPITGGGAPAASLTIIGVGSDAAPTVELTGISQPSSANEAVLSGSYEDVGCRPVGGTHFEISTNPGFMPSTSYAGSGGDGLFTATIPVQPNTTYYIRAYAWYAGLRTYSNSQVWTSQTLMCPTPPSLQWQRPLGGAVMESPLTSLLSSDGGYVVAGFSYSSDGDVTSNHGGPDVWVTKLDGDGVLQWQISLGGAADDYVNSILQTSDGGFLLLGSTWSIDGDMVDNHGQVDIWVAKLWGNGMVAWQQCLGGSGIDLPTAILETSDSRYLVTGTTESMDGDVTGNHGYQDVWLVELSMDGTMEWQRCLGGAYGEGAESVQRTWDGGYILSGWTDSYDGDVEGNHGGRDIWVAKLFDNGTVLWQKCLGGGGYEDSSSILQTMDGGYLVLGQTNSTNEDIPVSHGEGDIWVVKLSGTGDTQWHERLGGPNNEQPNSMLQTTDGGYVVLAYVTSAGGDISGHHGGGDIWVVKLSGNGTLEWQKCLGGTGDEYPGALSAASNGGVMVVGTSASFDGDVSGNHGTQDIWIVNLFGDGTLEWKQCLGGSDADQGRFVEQLETCEYIVLGTTYSSDEDVQGQHGYGDIWIVKLAP